MEKKINKVLNTITLVIAAMLAGILTVYSVIWLWTFISPRAHFEAGPIGLVCKIVAIATIVATAWYVPATISYILKRGKKFVQGEVLVVPMDKYISMIKRKDNLITEMASLASKYKVEAAHYKTVAEEYRKELDYLESAHWE